MALYLLCGITFDEVLCLTLLYWLLQTLAMFISSSQYWSVPHQTMLGWVVFFTVHEMWTPYGLQSLVLICTWLHLAYKWLITNGSQSLELCLAHNHVFLPKTCSKHCHCTNIMYVIIINLTINCPAVIRNQTFKKLLKCVKKQISNHKILRGSCAQI